MNNELQEKGQRYCLKCYKKNARKWRTKSRNSTDTERRDINIISNPGVV